MHLGTAGSGSYIRGNQSDILNLKGYVDPKSLIKTFIKAEIQAIYSPMVAILPVMEDYDYNYEEAIAHMNDERDFGNNYHFEDIVMIELAASIINKSPRRFHITEGNAVAMIEERREEEMKRPQRNIERRAEQYVVILKLPNQ